MNAQTVCHPKTLSAAAMIATLHFTTSQPQQVYAKTGGRIGGRAGFTKYRKMPRSSPDESVEVPRKIYIPEVVHIQQQPFPIYQYQTYTPSSPPPLPQQSSINFMLLLELIIFFYLAFLVVIYLFIQKK